MKKFKKISGQRFYDESYINVEFDKTVYYDCIFHGCTFKNVIWKNCQFKNTYILGNSFLKECVFEDSKFIGQHTSLGGPTKYLNCCFKNVEIKNVQFQDTDFENCQFSGSAENVALFGKAAPKGWQTKFTNVDLSEMSLNWVDFRCEFDLSTTIVNPAYNKQ